jgi:hypothetical protein
MMIDALVAAFPGAANQTHCFTHILNLVVKVILHQFDAPKSGEAKDPASQAILELAGDIGREEVEI